MKYKFVAGLSLWLTHVSEAWELGHNKQVRVAFIWPLMSLTTTTAMSDVERTPAPRRSGRERKIAQRFSLSTFCEVMMFCAY